MQQKTSVILFLNHLQLFEYILTFPLSLPLASLCAASKLLRSTLVLPENWWVEFEMRQNVCDEISNQIMDLYDESD